MTSRITRTLLEFLKRQDGPTAVEYAVIVSVLMLICVTALSVLGSNSHRAHQRSGTAVGSTGS